MLSVFKAVLHSTFVLAFETRVRIMGQVYDSVQNTEYVRNNRYVRSAEHLI